MSAETPPPTKKHRVITWKPEGAEKDPANARRTPRWLGIAIGVAVVLLILSFVRIPRGILPGALGDSDAGLVATDQAGNILSEFELRSRAEFSRVEAKKDVELARKVPADHPVIRQRLVYIQQKIDEADKDYTNHRYASAMRNFEAVSVEVKSLNEMIEDRRRAQSLSDQFLVDAARIQRWKAFDPDTFNAALTAHGATQSFLAQGSFSAARQKIEEGHTMLVSIEKFIADDLENHLSYGRAALASGDGPAAIASFNRALELQPGNELAAKSLERARKVDQVFKLIAEGKRLEALGNLENARAAFEKAFALDDQNATAQASIARLKGAIKERDYEAHLAAADKARDQKKWDDVIAAYEAALKIFPDKKDVQKQLAEARVHQREANIQRMLAEAYAYERTYDWEGAKRKYLELLDYEPAQADANEGILRTGKVVRALLVFEKRIEEARSQAQRAQFQEAIAAFNEAMSSKPSYLELTPEQTQLKNLLELQSKPVQVTFVSDNKTYVTINGSQGKMLNKFNSTTVPLYPGDYVVVGRRRGYEDVEERIRVRGGDAVPPVTIIASKRT